MPSADYVRSPLTYDDLTRFVGQRVRLTYRTRQVSGVLKCWSPASRPEIKSFEFSGQSINHFEAHSNAWPRLIEVMGPNGRYQPAPIDSSGPEEA